MWALTSLFAANDRAEISQTVSSSRSPGLCCGPCVCCADALAGGLQHGLTHHLLPMEEAAMK